MKTTTKIITLLVTAMFVVVFLVGNSVLAQQAKAKAWPVGDKDKAMKAPVQGDVNAGKELWAKHCKSCHGSAGLGDGPKAATLDVPVGDFSTAKFQGQSDGDIFFKLTEGRGKMPAFKKNITDDNERWNLVNYMRTLKGK